MYKTFLLISSLFAVSAYLILSHESNKLLPNYLYINSLNLLSHQITQEKNAKKLSIVVLGSSEVAGSNIPVNSTLSDYLNSSQERYYFYNLASLQLTMVEVLTYFLQSLEYKPDAFVLGISPSTMQLNSGSVVSYANLDSIQSYIPKNLYEHIKKVESKKFHLSPYFSNLIPRSLPHQWLLDFKTYVFNLQQIWFPGVFPKGFWGTKTINAQTLAIEDNPQWHVIQQIKQECDRRGIPLIVYLSPAYDARISYGEFYKNYSEFFLLKFRQQNIPAFDYTDLFYNDVSKFIDFVHLKPEGFKLLSDRLLSDIKEFLP